MKEFIVHLDKDLAGCLSNTYTISSNSISAITSSAVSGGGSAEVEVCEKNEPGDAGGGGSFLGVTSSNRPFSVLTTKINLLVEVER